MVDGNRPQVVNIGSYPTMTALDNHQSLHKPIYTILLLAHNDFTKNAINVFDSPEEMHYEQADVSFDVAFEFDVLTFQEFSYILYLNFHHQVAHRENKFAGWHDDIANLKVQALFSLLIILVVESSLILSKSCSPNSSKLCDKGRYSSQELNIDK